MSTKKGGDSEPIGRHADASQNRGNLKVEPLPAKSHWQFICSGLLLVLWILFLAWMAAQG